MINDSFNKLSTSLQQALYQEVKQNWTTQSGQIKRNKHILYMTPENAGIYKNGEELPWPIVSMLLQRELQDI